MEITFKTNKLERCCNNYKVAVKSLGEQTAKKLIQRLNELRAADDLSMISHLPPPRLHSINGIRPGCFAVDLGHPMRLVFTIDQAPIPRAADGGIDHAHVVRIMILQVEDYHGKQK